MLIVFVIVPKVFGALMSRRWGAKARRVGQVERLRPELEVARATHIEPLCHDEVEILVAWRTRDTNRTVAPAATWNACERIDVEPAVDVLVGRYGIPNAVRPLVAAHPLQRGSGAIDHRDRETRSRLEDRAEPPATKNGVHRSGRVTAPLASLAKGQLVVGREHEVVPGIENAGP